MFLIKALRWAYSDTLKALGFLGSVTLFLVALMTFIAYPFETLMFVVVGGGIVALFSLFF